LLSLPDSGNMTTELKQAGNAMSEPSTIQLASNPNIEMHDVGDGQRFAIVDDFLADPHELTANVAAYAGTFVSNPMGHPSRGRDMSERELQDIHRFIRSRLSRHFPFLRAGVLLKAFMSNVSLKPEELSVYHRMCHIDPRARADYHTYAGVVYLFAKPELGGTAFYRWKAKDIAVRTFELASRDHEAALRYLEKNTETYRKAPEYMTRSNEIAELLQAVPAKFNRLVFYNGEIPHSGHITQPQLLSSDPAKGRLTLNFFAAVKAKDAAAAAAE